MYRHELILDETGRCQSKSRSENLIDDDEHYNEITQAYNSLYSKPQKGSFRPSKAQTERIQKKNLELMRENQKRKEAQEKARKEKKFLERVAKIRALNGRKSGTTTTTLTGGW